MYFLFTDSLRVYFKYKCKTTIKKGFQGLLAGWLAYAEYRLMDKLN